MIKTFTAFTPFQIALLKAKKQETNLSAVGSLDVI